MLSRRRVRLAIVPCDRALLGWPDLFGGAIAGEAMGAVIVYGILNALVFTRGQPWRDRAFPVLLAGFLCALILSGLFAG